MASSTSDPLEIVMGSISTSLVFAFLKTTAPVFPSSKNHHSSDSASIAATIKSSYDLSTHGQMNKEKLN